MSRSPKNNVRTIALARLISIAGGAAAYTALMYSIYQRTGSAAWLSATLFLTFGVAGFAAPVAGAIGDRYNRQWVMVGSDLAGAACFLGMAFVHEPHLLLGLAFLSALAEAPFLAASVAAIPSIIGEEQIGWANGLIAVGRNGGIMLGPVLGGVLVASIGPGAVFGVNALSFVISAALVLTVRARFSEPGSHAEHEEHKGMIAGFRFVAKDRVLRILMLAWFTMVLGFGMGMVADLPLLSIFGAGSVGYGLLVGSWGAGSVLGSLGGRFLNERNEIRVLFWGTAALALSTGAVSVAPWLVLVFVFIFANGVGDAITMVAEQNLVQRRAPDAVRSRVSAAIEAGFMIALAVSYIAAAPVLNAVGARGVYAVGGVAAGIGTLLLLPLLLRPERRARVTEPELVEAEVERAGR